MTWCSKALHNSRFWLCITHHTMDIMHLLPQLITIPATAFLMGTPERALSALAKAYGGTRESYREESPQHLLALPAFEIAQVPVTNALYAAYTAATGAIPPAHWRGPQPPAPLHDHPVVNVNWHDAQAFCRWLTRTVQSSKFKVQSERSHSQPLFARLAARLSAVVYRLPSTVYRLPTEAEWEHAARGSDGRTFPWGDAWDTARANTQEAGHATTPVDAHPGGASHYGCLDMCGNTWEWTASLDRPYPYALDGREHQRVDGRRILRGGCYVNPHGYARCACRFRLAPATRNEFLGFRVVRARPHMLNKAAHMSQ